MVSQDYRVIWLETDVLAYTSWSLLTNPYENDKRVLPDNKGEERRESPWGGR